MTELETHSCALEEPEKVPENYSYCVYMGRGKAPGSCNYFVLLVLEKVPGYNCSVLVEQERALSTHSCYCCTIEELEMVLEIHNHEPVAVKVRAGYSHERS